MKANAITFLVAMLLSASVFANTRIEGKVHDLNLEDQTFTIHDSDTGQLHVLAFTDKTKVVVDRMEFNELSRLNIGEHVVYKKGKVKKGKKNVDYIEARIEEIDMENQRITYVDQRTGKTKTLPFNDAATKKSDAEEYDVDELRSGQRVVLEVVKL